MKQHVACSFLIMLAWGGLLTRAAERYEVVVQQGVPARMRDGMILFADIYRPKAEGRFPVLLTRTPYDKGGLLDSGPVIGQAAASRGYVVIIQDVRGRYTSEGEWCPFTHESEDGYDTVEWAASLCYSNGKVGMFGGSYTGATEMLTAIAAPPHLAGIFSVLTASNCHDGWVYQGGAFEQGLNESWTSSFLAPETLKRRVRQSVNRMPRLLKLPLSSYPLFDPGTPIDWTEGPQNLAPYLIDWLAHPAYDDYWKRISIDDHDNKISVPGYHVAGWYDVFQGGTIRNYMHIKERGGSDSARNGQRLMVGPWDHGALTSKVGDIDFGPEARTGPEPFDTDSIMLRWYDRLLKGIANGIDTERPVRIFVMGRNVWREEDEWPLARAKGVRYYLHSSGKANTLAGTGELDRNIPANESPDLYDYDPMNPVPTRGGGLCCEGMLQPPGAFDQRPVETRSDVLVFTTPAFNADVEVTGPVSLELFVASSAVDTDFTGKLVDVWPDGYAQNLTDGIVRARYRNSPEKAEFMNPGEVNKLTVDLWATSNVFLKGHKLRLEVSSSNFPRFDRNLNTGDDQGRSARWAKATNSIYHDREHPSALLVSVVPQQSR